VLMHINDPSHLEQALEAMREQPRCDDAAYILSLASAADRVQQAASEVFPRATLRSLRDVLFHARGKLPSSELRWLQQLNSAYSFARHSTPLGVQARCGEVVRMLAGATGGHGAVDHGKQQSGGGKPDRAGHVGLAPFPSTLFGGRDACLAGPRAESCSVHAQRFQEVDERISRLEADIASMHDRIGKQAGVEAHAEECEESMEQDLDESQVQDGPDHLAPNRDEAVDEKRQNTNELECEETPGRVWFDDLAASSDAAVGDKSEEESEFVKDEVFVHDASPQGEARGFKTESVQVSVPTQVDIQVGPEDLAASPDEAEGVENLVVSELHGEEASQQEQGEEAASAQEASEEGEVSELEDGDVHDPREASVAGDLARGVTSSASIENENHDTRDVERCSSMGSNRSESSSELGGHARHVEPGPHGTTLEEGMSRMQEQIRAGIPALVEAIMRDLPPPPAELLRRRR